MAHPDEILEQQYRTLGRLKPIIEKHNIYLAEGTALAFYLRHRVSRDLDLFSSNGNLDLEGTRRELVELDGTQVVSMTDAALRLLINGMLLPDGMTLEKWQIIKQWFSQEVPKVLRQRLAQDPAKKPTRCCEATRARSFRQTPTGFSQNPREKAHPMLRSNEGAPSTAVSDKRTRSARGSCG